MPKTERLPTTMHAIQVELKRLAPELNDCCADDPRMDEVLTRMERLYTRARVLSKHAPGRC